MFSQKTIDGLRSGRWETKVRAGGYYVPLVIKVESGRMYFYHAFNKPLQKEIKECFEDRKWHGFEDNPRKNWSAPITFRNLFQLEALQGTYGSNPYARWDSFPDRSEEVREVFKSKGADPYAHQVEMVNQALGVNWAIWAAEMGLGKSICALVTAEMCGYTGPYLWVGPRSGLVAAKTEYLRWGSSLTPTFVTYDGVKKLVNQGYPDEFQIIVFDEMFNCKTPKAERSKCCKMIADDSRTKFGENCMLIGMGGTPAPKNPADWWMQCEIICPGFIREANIFIFRERLAVIEEQEGLHGKFKKVKAWKDSEDKCANCGEPSAALIHQPGMDHTYHTFKPGVNEVAALGKRLTGLVGVWKKKDCLDLPDKRYHLHELKPTQEVLNIAKTIVNTTTRAVDCMIKLRTLSDGFLYESTPTGEMIPCPGCEGTGQITEYFDKDEPDAYLADDEIQESVRYEEVFEGSEFVETKKRTISLGSRHAPCAICKGLREIEKKERTIREIECPKYDLLGSLMEQHEGPGRLNVYSGFEGSIIRVTDYAIKKGWTVIKADGKGWKATSPLDGVLDWSSEEMVYHYQNSQAAYPKMLFNGQPGAAGQGLTLTAAPSTFFLSNDFIPVNRFQAEDRGHRIGMDEVRGGQIHDCSHLPTDMKVIQSLLSSRRLQNISMDAIRDAFN